MEGLGKQNDDKYSAHFEPWKQTLSDFFLAFISTWDFLSYSAEYS